MKNDSNEHTLQSVVSGVWRSWILIMFATAGILRSHAQGTVTFNEPWISIGGVSAYQYTDTSGMRFQVTPLPPNQLVYDQMTRISSVYGEFTPYNGTPYLRFDRSRLSTDFVVFSLIDGSTFGVASAELADIVVPSRTAVSIVFNGYRADNSMVSQTITTPGAGASAFQTYVFNSAFSSGLTRVEITSPTWAMDNLVFIPEPGSATLVLLGLVPLALRKRRVR